MSRYTRQHSPYLGVKIYQAAFALFRCQDIPGNICLIRVSRYNRQHLPYSGVKIYQAAFALFRCHDIPGSIRLIQESRCTRHHTPYSMSRLNHAAFSLIRVSRCTRHSPYSVIKFYQAFAFLRVSCYTFHKIKINNFIPGNSGIKLPTI